MRVTFKLGDEDLAHLKRMLRSAAAAAKEKDPQKIVDAALAMARRAREAEPPDYVLERITTPGGEATPAPRPHPGQAPARPGRGRRRPALQVLVGKQNYLV